MSADLFKRSLSRVYLCVYCERSIVERIKKQDTIKSRHKHNREGKREKAVTVFSSELTYDGTKQS